MDNKLITTSYYIPEREALFVTADMSGFLIDYYLHLKQFVPDFAPAHDEQLKSLMGCFAIHLTLHPAQECHAWTMHLVAAEPFSLFVTGEAERGFLVGSALSGQIRHTDVTMLHAQVMRGGESSRSSVQAESSDPLAVVEHFYRQSEQLPIRLYRSTTSDTLSAIAAMPGYDAEWFESVDILEYGTIVGTSRKVMRTCGFEFRCDCSPEKLIPYFRSIDADALAELYGTDTELIITCPRCSRIFQVSRSQVERTDN